MALRKVTYRMYPNETQAARLEELLCLHQRVYNAALEERIHTYRETGGTLGLSAQCKALTCWRRGSPALAGVNAQSLQVTLKRLDLAYAAFFRRVKAGERAGFPRFKSVRRFRGWGYKTHGDGWRLHAGDHLNHGYARLSGVGHVRLRGRSRNDGTPKTSEVLYKENAWYLSVTIECEPKREHGAAAIGLDWGIETFATVVDAKGTSTAISNPRFLDRAELQRLKRLQQSVSRKKNLRSHRRRQAVRRLAVEHARIARRRNDFLHQHSAHLIARCGLVATEQLSVRNMTAAGGACKRGLNRNILDTAPAAFIARLKSKAEEAGVEWREVPTRQVKPSQTCHRCGARKKKPLSERWHRCDCGASCSRDENAARVMLNWALTGSATGQELAEAGSGRGLAALNRETHAIAAPAV